MNLTNWKDEHNSLHARSSPRKSTARKCGLALSAAVLLGAVATVPSQAAPRTQGIDGQTARAARAVVSADTTSDSPYPGGTWTPGPAEFGSEVDKQTITLPSGLRLSVTVNYPTSLATGERATGNFPVIVHDNPYTDEGFFGSDSYYAEHGYIWANVRPRGTGTSEGVEDLAGPGSQEDAKGIIDWAAYDLQGSDGRVGLFGCSYTGLHALTDAATVGRNSPLKAVVGMCAAASPGYFSHESMFRGGLLSPFANFAGLYGTATGGQQGSIDLWNQLQDNFTSGGPLAYDGDFWEVREPEDAARSLARSGVATLMWTGWNDEAEASALQQMAGMQNTVAGRPSRLPMTPRQRTSAKHQIVVGNGGHGQNGETDQAVTLEWFDTWIKGVDTGLRDTQAPFHLRDLTTGEWYNVSSYPMVDRYATYDLSESAMSLSGDGVTRDAAKLKWGPPEEEGTSLEFTSTPMTSGATLAGPISATIYASSSNTNMELEATLSDVAPDGSVTDVSAWNPVLGSQHRLDPTMNWRDSTGKLIRPWTRQDEDVFLKPGKTYRFDINMEPRVATIKPGHALRLTIATRVPFEAACEAGATDHPCYYSAPQQETLPGGEYTIYFGKGQRSVLNVPVLPYKCFTPVKSAVTPTSNSLGLPAWDNIVTSVDWKTTSQCVG